jgi:hypothetical protein
MKVQNQRTMKFTWMTADIGLFLDCSNTKWLALKTWALAIWWRKTNERPGPTSPAIVSWRCRRRKYRAMNSRHLAATYWLIDSSGRRRRKKKRNVNGRSKIVCATASDFSQCPTNSITHERKVYKSWILYPSRSMDLVRSAGNCRNVHYTWPYWLDGSCDPMWRKWTCAV